tara:strand:+ start:538 stop:786 length:249 start_codon:yes stop_codon:yes gene_type:complete
LSGLVGYETFKKDLFFWHSFITAIMGGFLFGVIMWFLFPNVNKFQRNFTIGCVIVSGGIWLLQNLVNDYPWWYSEFFISFLN